MKSIIELQFCYLELLANHSDLKVKNNALESALKEQNEALRKGQDQLLLKDEELLKLVRSLDGHNKQKQDFHHENQILKKEITVSLLFSILTLFVYSLYVLTYSFFKSNKKKIFIVTEILSSNYISTVEEKSKKMCCIKQRRD